MDKRILFISHEATRTGAPILLLSLARLLVKKGCTIDFLLKYDGPLEHEFRTIGDTRIIHKFPSSYIDEGVKRVRNKLTRKRIKGDLDKYQFILSNTITNGDLHDLLEGQENVFTYVHELQYTITSCVPEWKMKNVLAHTHMFIAPSKAVKDCLQLEHGIDAGRIVQLPYFIPDHYPHKTAYRAAMRKKLGISADSFVVGGMGVMGWRKGSDIFLQVARKLMQAGTDIRFIWCGGDPKSADWLAMSHDIKHMGLENSILLIPSTSEALQVMAAFDVFFLSSREDPYPLVVLEAGMMELPLVCYRGSGGAPEFVENDCGRIVDYLDIEATASALKELRGDQEIYRALSGNARKKYLSLHTEDRVFETFRDLHSLQQPINALS